MNVKFSKIVGIFKFWSEIQGQILFKKKNEGTICFGSK